MNAFENRGITVFFPAFNDAPNIAALVRNAADILSRLTSDPEIIVVDDGSRDSTAEVLDGLLPQIPFLRVKTHETNKGYGAALRSGFKAAAKDLVFYTDGDGQYDVRELEKLYQALSDEVDVVNGYKLNRADGLHRKLFGGIYARFTRKLFRLPIRDVDCDFRLIRKSSLDRVDLKTSSGAICVELVDKLASSGARFVEVGVNHYPRVAGRSQFLSPSRVLRTMVDIAALWFRRSRNQNIRRTLPASMEHAPAADK
jgi:glycosyltransferase involved in cell wall biosynthesis